MFLILGQVEEAKVKEAQLRNELKKHNIDISTTQQVQFPSVCESFFFLILAYNLFLIIHIFLGMLTLLFWGPKPYGNYNPVTYWTLK